MILEQEIEIEVPFHDVDAAHLVWHGHYAKYLELARCALLDRIGYNYDHMSYSGYSWPVIELFLRYPGAARFKQKLKVKATLAEWEHRLKFDYVISDALSGQRLTKGHSVQVAVDLKTGVMQLESPRKLREIMSALT